MHAQFCNGFDFNITEGKMPKDEETNIEEANPSTWADAKGTPSIDTSASNLTVTAAVPTYATQD